jgi:phytoene synthase
MSAALKRMAKGGKTFYFASRWLEPAARNDAAIAYGFCRLVDDIADNTPASPQRTILLEELRDYISGKTSRLIAPVPEAAAMLELIGRYPEIASATRELVEACLADLPGIVIDDSTDLIRYAHGVAGTVGLIMYPILGGRDPQGRAFAADLGVAMQLTNIARDILDDLRNNRVYLPRKWLADHDLKGLLCHDPRIETAAVRATEKLLTLADQHYQRGLSGLSYLNPRSRFAIRVAADCYAAIGARVIRNGSLLRTRAVVPLHSKILIAVRAANIERSSPIAATIEGIAR